MGFRNRKIAIPALAALLLFSSVGIASADPPLQEAHPPIHMKNNGATPTYKNGFSPAQIKKAYGMDKLEAKYTGENQTIAIVDAYGSPTIENDLQVFNTQFGLPAASLTIAYPQGKPKKPDAGWALETSLDVEWAHALAPKAKILLVVAKSAALTDLIDAIDYATLNGAQVVSNSWGGSEFSSEAMYDAHFQHAGVVYVASSGDDGAGMSWPASSPHVLSVGGTTLKTGPDGSYVSESGWSGSGGGVSAYEARPAYENNWSGIVGTHRGGPDVAWNADPNSGVAVYDSTQLNGQKGWFQVGGTSFGAPCWAALIALANNGRSSSLTSATAIASLYTLAGLTASPGYNGNYQDIVSGNNGTFNAQAGFDLVTGIGTPQAQALIPALSISP
ncbi:S53 family peptidase [Paenibacillus cremeus]|uniref:S8 family serine peptidase n=1 Tax=Paenibacillus cremeus TaxID=2163881 RepID=A0A559KFW3_9BACL|nr:S53 family peptidase [Paenibacillus cremeus]TVY11020.1 S8 family serine peptidase [Paenibacillus cremeus]